MNLKFWKKDDLALPELSNSYSRNELGLKDTSGLDLSTGFDPAPQSLMPQGMQAPPTPQYSFPSSFSQQAPSYPPTAQAPVFDKEDQSHSVSKDLEIIAAKLDTIRAQLEMLNTRVAHIEQSQQQVQPKRPWY